MEPTKPIKIETESESESEDGGGVTYVFDIADYVDAGESVRGVRLSVAEAVGAPVGGGLPTLPVNQSALARLLEPRRYDGSSDDVSVSFPFETYDVTVTSAGRVVIDGTE